MRRLLIATLLFAATASAAVTRVDIIESLQEPRGLRAESRRGGGNAGPRTPVDGGRRSQDHRSGGSALGFPDEPRRREIAGAAEAGRGAPWRAPYGDCFTASNVVRHIR